MIHMILFSDVFQVTEEKHITDYFSKNSKIWLMSVNITFFMQFIATILIYQ